MPLYKWATGPQHKLLYHAICSCWPCHYKRSFHESYLTSSFWGEEGAWLVQCISLDVYSKRMQLDTSWHDDRVSKVFIRFATWYFWALSSFSQHLWEPYTVFISTHFLLPLRTHLHPWQHLRKQKNVNRKKRQGSEWMGTQPILFSVCFLTPSFPSEFVCCWERRFFKMGIISKEHLNHWRASHGAGAQLHLHWQLCQESTRQASAEEEWKFILWCTIGGLVLWSPSV